MAYGEQYRKPRQSFTGVKMERPTMPELSPEEQAEFAAFRQARQLVGDHKNKPSRPAGPVKAFKVGAIQCSVWENENLSPEGQVFVSKSVTFERRYKDKNGEWKSTNSLRANDLPKAVVLLQQAYEYILLHGGEE